MWQNHIHLLDFFIYLVSERYEYFVYILGDLVATEDELRSGCPRVALSYWLDPRRFKIPSFNFSIIAINEFWQKI